MKITLGLYFSNTYCHAAIMSRYRRLLKFSMHHIPLEGSAPLDYQYTLSKLLQHALKPDQVILGLASQHILKQTFTVDSQLTDKEIILFLKHQTKAPFLDYQSITKSNEKHIIECYLTQETAISRYQKYFNACKLPLHVIDSNTLALSRTLRHFNVTAIASHSLRKALLSIQETVPTIKHPRDLITVGLSLWSKNVD